ncbi:MAG: patatin-like phospholipase family protein [Verrucomicrobia bacterium]|nr:patatin-like phospholipase family protein [Verrucomicrobiota bacterium]
MPAAETLPTVRATPCRILSLDGGGAKGFYTIGILKEIEAMIGTPLHEKFDIVFGTSTGSIIGALVALGMSVEEIHKLYRNYVPSIMREKWKSRRSAALIKLAGTVFGERKFDAFRCHVGIVATHWEHERPMIFKTSAAQAHGRTASFKPGFDCTIAQAVTASCSAYPFFRRYFVKTSLGEEPIELVDGGYCANNPTLYAIADAVGPMGKSPSELRIISLGVGNYPEPKRRGLGRFVRMINLVQLLQKTLDTNTKSMEQLRAILFKEAPTVRISETFSQPEMATDLMEHDLSKLDRLYQRGRESFAANESQLRAALL